MNLRESQLKQLILEEAQRYIIERQVEEFVCILKEELAKEGIVLNEEQLMEVGDWLRRAKLKAKGLGKKAVPALTGAALALGAASAGKEAYDAEQDWQQAKAERYQDAAERMADYEFWDVEALTKAVYGPFQTWGWRAGPQETGTLLPEVPEDFKVAHDIPSEQAAKVMPPSWTVMKKVMEDKQLKKDVPGSEELSADAGEEGAPLYTPELSPELNKPWNEMSEKEQAANRGQASQNIDTFFEDYGDKLDYAQNTTSTGKEMWLYEVPFSELDENYVLPDAGITVGQYYNELMHGHQREGGEFYSGHSNLQQQLRK